MIKIYVCYSIYDLNSAKDIQKALSASNKFDSWDKGKVLAGDNEEEICIKKLEESEIVLLLISSDFLSDESIRSELNRAITLKKQSQVLLVVVKLRSVYIEGHPELESLLMFPTGKKFISHYKAKEDAYTELIQSLLMWHKEYSNQLNFNKLMNKSLNQKEMHQFVIKVFKMQFKNFYELKRSPFYSTFCAEDIYLPRKVVIKIIHNWAILDDRKFTNELKYFYDKTKHMSTFKHRNIKTLYSARFDNAIKYIVQEYIDGDPLSYIIHLTGRIPIVEVIRVLKKIGSALAYGHDKGLIHREINVDNILFDEELEPVLSPFKWVNPQEHTVDILNLENFKYHSPEQIEINETSTFSDQYSLGLVLFEMITGEALFDSDILQICNQRKNIYENPKVIKDRLLEWNCPEELMNVIMKMLSSKASDRFESIAEILETVDFFEKKYKDEAASTVIQSYYRCCFMNKDFFKDFYEDFFARNSNVEEEFFPHQKDDWRIHYRKLRYTLNVVLTIGGMISNDYLHKVRDIHVRKNINARAYQDFCDSLLYVVSKNDKKKWDKDPSIKESWVLLLKNSVNYMMGNSLALE